jgi:hypothetical protein
MAFSVPETPEAVVQVPHANVGYQLTTASAEQIIHEEPAETVAITFYTTSHIAKKAEHPQCFKIKKTKPPIFSPRMHDRRHVAN